MRENTIDGYPYDPANAPWPCRYVHDEVWKKIDNRELTDLVSAVGNSRLETAQKIICQHFPHASEKEQAQALAAIAAKPQYSEMYNQIALFTVLIFKALKLTGLAYDEQQLYAANNRMAKVACHFARLPNIDDVLLDALLEKAAQQITHDMDFMQEVIGEDPVIVEYARPYIAQPKVLTLPSESIFAAMPHLAAPEEDYVYNVA